MPDPDPASTPSTEATGAPVGDPDGPFGATSGPAVVSGLTSHALAGKVAVVTGGGAGVGRGIALGLASAGCDLALVGRSQGNLDEAAALVAARGVRAHTYLADVSDLDAAPRIVEAVVADLGRLDILVNNAYDGGYGPLLRMSNEQFQRGFLTGPFASFAWMTAAYPHLKATGDGVIFNLVTSAMARWDMSNYGAYAAAKRAVQSLTHTAASEWGPDGIRVLSIAPHALSPGVQGWAKRFPEEAARFIKTIPAGRIGDCELDIGNAVAALATPAMRYLSGATVPLDGGQATFD